MKVLTTAGLTKLIQLIKSAFISVNDVEQTTEVSLATVATTGSYNDLRNKPTIPAAQVNSDWNASSGVAEILNKPSLATVATTGSYSDLTGQPTIPVVYNSTITFTQGGTTKGTITLNQSSNQTIALDAGGGGGSSYTAGTGIDITNNVISANIATSVSSSSTNSEAVGAKLFYDTCGDIETLINAL